MDQLIEQISQKTGLPAEQAQAAADTVLEFLKGKLPESVGGLLDQAIEGGGEGGEGGGLGEMAKGLAGGLFNK